MTEGFVLDRSYSHVVQIIFDRPPVNALRFADYAALVATLRSLEAEPEVRCIVLRGAGDRAFQGGHDLREFAAIGVAEMRAGLVHARNLHHALSGLALPVLAAVNGAAIGNGLAMAALCDFRFAVCTATFALPEIRRGVFGGAAAVGRLVPPGWLRRLALTGEKVDATTALRIGLVDELVEPDQLMGRVLSLAAEVAASPPQAVRALRPVMGRILEATYLEAYDLERDLTLGCASA